MDLLAQYSKTKGKSNVKGNLCENCCFSLPWKSLCELEILTLLQS